MSCAVVLSTGNVVTVNDALVAPAGTVTVGGTLADPGRLLLRLTATPPAGAATAECDRTGGRRASGHAGRADGEAGECRQVRVHDEVDRAGDTTARSRRW